MMDLHDWNITAIQINKEGNQAFIYACSPNRDQAVIVLDRLYRFRVDNFCEGNIILDYEWYAPDEMPGTLIVWLFHLDESAGALQSVINDIKKRDLKLFSLVPSYGCEILALCQSIVVRELR